MSKQRDNEAWAGRFHMDVFQKGRTRVIDEMIDWDLFGEIPIIPWELQHGREKVKKIASAVIDAMPKIAE